MKINITLRKFLGWTFLLAVSFIPVLLWFKYGAGFSEFTDYQTITHSLGELFGLVGMTMFALTFLLSTRIKFIEDIFGGLDKVYIAHGILGGTALIFVLFHPIFLVLKFIPSNIYLAALYLLPSSYWEVNFGIIAFISLIVLIYVTLYTGIKYHNWKISHKFLGLVFIFAMFHIFLVRGEISGDLIFKGYYFYATAVSLIGLGGFSYSLFIKKTIFQEAFYNVERIEKKKEIYEITFIPEAKPIEYKSGQFIFVRFYNEHLSKESHPFSIISKSNEPRIKILIKNLGDFTSNIHKVKIGDKVSIEGPYGRFNFYEKDHLDQVWIAGGVGITPFLGMAEDLKNNGLDKKVDLYYSVKTEEDLISSENLKSVEKINKNFRFIPWVSGKKGHLTAKDIESRSGDLKKKEFYLCGPSIFKNSIRNDLIKSKVPKRRMHEEEFNFR